MTVDCTFCAIAAGSVPAALVLDEPEVLAFLDVRPLFPGHVLVVPRRHHGTLLDLPAGDMAGLFTAVQRLAGAVTAAMGAQGTFVAVNNVVSQSVPHLHVHVVPRTKGDGLRGFFWPRTRYQEGEADAVAARIRAQIR
ncbi:MAG TPA: HIT family protein [Acidimicrobiales bacterium]|nr:HIT family protein [Acidimicrobiales bacterium]